MTFSTSFSISGSPLEESQDAKVGAKSVACLLEKDLAAAVLVDLVEDLRSLLLSASLFRHARNKLGLINASIVVKVRLVEHLPGLQARVQVRKESCELFASDETFVRSGIAQAFVLATRTALGDLAVLIVPMLGALGGYLTGSNTGAGGLAMPVAASLTQTRPLQRRKLPVQFLWRSLL